MKYHLVATNQYKLIAIPYNLNKKEYKCKTKRQSTFFSNFTFEIFFPRIPLERLSSFRSPFVGNALTIKGVKKICRVYREEYSSNKMISFSSRRVGDVDRIRLECECKQNKTAAAAGSSLFSLSPF